RPQRPAPGHVPPFHPRHPRLRALAGAIVDLAGGDPAGAPQRPADLADARADPRAAGPPGLVVLHAIALAAGHGRVPDAQARGDLDGADDAGTERLGPDPPAPRRSRRSDRLRGAAPDDRAERARRPARRHAAGLQPGPGLSASLVDRPLPAVPRFGTVVVRH